MIRWRLRTRRHAGTSTSSWSIRLVWYIIMAFLRHTHSLTWRDRPSRFASTSIYGRSLSCYWHQCVPYCVFSAYLLLTTTFARTLLVWIVRDSHPLDSAGMIN